MLPVQASLSLLLEPNFSLTVLTQRVPDQKECLQQILKLFGIVGIHLQTTMIMSLKEGQNPVGLILLLRKVSIKSTLACHASEPIFESWVKLLGPPLSQTLKKF